MKSTQQTLAFSTERARWSPCLKYRYTLHRSFRSVDGANRRLLWVMLNPSTADDVEDDPTIRRCISFSKRDGYDGFVVCNLYAFRATDPKELLDVEDPVGLENDVYIADIAHEVMGVVLAYGAFIENIPGGRDRAVQVESLIRLCGHSPLCLGTTKAGLPRHPLYVRSNQQLVVFPCTT